jgi:hypothetical protein
MSTTTQSRRLQVSAWPFRPTHLVLLTCPQNVFGCARVITKHYGLRGVYQGTRAMVSQPHQRCLSLARSLFLLEQLLISVHCVTQGSAPLSSATYLRFRSTLASTSSRDELSRAQASPHPRWYTTPGLPQGSRTHLVSDDDCTCARRRRLQEGWKYLVAGGTGGLLYWVLTYPIDVIKVHDAALPQPSPPSHPVHTILAPLLTCSHSRTWRSVEHADGRSRPAPAQVPRHRALCQVDLAASSFHIQLTH